MSDPIKTLLDDLRERLDESEKQQLESISSLSTLLQRIENAKVMAKLSQRGIPKIEVAHDTLLNAHLSTMKDVQLLTAAVNSLCEIVGSIVVQVDPSTLETLAGDPIDQLALPGTLAETFAKEHNAGKPQGEYVSIRGMVAGAESKASEPMCACTDEFGADRCELHMGGC